MLKESCVFVNDQRLRGAHWGLPSSFELRASHDARRVFWTFTLPEEERFSAGCCEACSPMPRHFSERSQEGDRSHAVPNMGASQAGR